MICTYIMKYSQFQRGNHQSITQFTIKKLFFFFIRFWGGSNYFTFYFTRDSIAILEIYFEGIFVATIILSQFHPSTLCPLHVLPASRSKNMGNLVLYTDFKTRKRRSIWFRCNFKQTNRGSRFARGKCKNLLPTATATTRAPASVEAVPQVCHAMPSARVSECMT